MQKRALITGVSSGIGYDALRYLVAEGYHVYGTIRKQADLERLTAEFGDRYHPVLCDVADAEKTKQAIAAILPELEQGGLQVLINNAGLAVPGPLEFVSEEDFKYQLEVNLFAVRRITNLLLPYLGRDEKYQPGHIINISSVSGLFNSPFVGPYCISKHALESMTEVYRRELFDYGIKVVCIQPGPIKTPIWTKNPDLDTKYAETPYGKTLEKASTIMANSEKDALPVEKVTEAIAKIIKSKNPSPRNIVHKNKWMFLLMRNVLPTRMVDKLVAKTMRNSEKHRPF